MSPDEVWTRSKYSQGELHNAHPWGYPVYVLESRLQDGNKFPKWIKRSMRDQYLGTSCFSDLWAKNGPLLGPTELDI